MRTTFHYLSSCIANHLGYEATRVIMVGFGFQSIAKSAFTDMNKNHAAIMIKVAQFAARQQR
jgi:hypothetical protein